VRAADGVFTVTLTLGARVQLTDAAFGALVAAFPNSGFMGVPLLVALLGPAAAGPVICTLLVDLFVTSSLCIALAQLHGAAGTGLRAALPRALRRAAGNPLPWAIAAGALLSLAGIGLPGPVDVVVRMLGRRGQPVALFTIGAVLWPRRAARAHAHAAGALPAGGADQAAAAPAAGVRGDGRCGPVGRAAGGIPDRGVTLAAALPSASNVAMLAERYGADNGRISRIIMSSTVLAFASFTLLAWAFGVQPRS
jgi:malonate transporter